MSKKIKEVDIKIIPYDSEGYKESLNLRNKELRQPLGLNLFDEDLSRDADEVHIGAYSEGKLIGILILVPGEDFTITMRQVAVEVFWQGKGIGNQMVNFAETYCIDNGFEKITLHARKSAMAFYEGMDYEVDGDSFMEVGIPHFMMYKKIAQSSKQNKVWKFVYIFALALLIDYCINFVGGIIRGVAQMTLDFSGGSGYLLSNLYTLIPIAILALMITNSRKRYPYALIFKHGAFYIGVFFAVRFAVGLLNIPVFIVALKSFNSMDYYSNRYMLLPIVSAIVTILSSLIRLFLAYKLIKKGR